MSCLAALAYQADSLPLSHQGSPGDKFAFQVKNLPARKKKQETQVQTLGWEDPLEKGMATHSRILA